MSEQTEREVLSHHTFILPLMWDVVKSGGLQDFLNHKHHISIKDRLDMEAVMRALANSGYWEVSPCYTEIGIPEAQRTPGYFRDDVESGAMDYYKEYCFFIMTFVPGIQFPKFEDRFLSARNTHEE